MTLSNSHNIIIIIIVIIIIIIILLLYLITFYKGNLGGRVEYI